MRRDHERARKDPERSDAQERPAENAPAAGVLALQRSAGNRAVAAMLARSPDTAAPKGEEKAAGQHAVFPGIGTIPLQSIQFGGGGPPGRARDEPAVRDIVCTSLQGEHSAALMRASLEGKGVDVEIIMPSGKGTLIIKLTNAMVTSYSTGSGGGDKPMETWALNFTAIEYRYQGEDA
jgi:hypothetical protein